MGMAILNMEMFSVETAKYEICCAAEASCCWGRSAWSPKVLELECRGPSSQSHGQTHVGRTHKTQSNYLVNEV